MKAYEKCTNLTTNRSHSYKSFSSTDLAVFDFYFFKFQNKHKHIFKLNFSSKLNSSSKTELSKTAFFFRGSVWTHKFAFMDKSTASTSCVSSSLSYYPSLFSISIIASSSLSSSLLSPLSFSFFSSSFSRLAFPS